MSERVLSREGSSLLKVFLSCRNTMSRLVGRIVNRHEIDDILQEAFARSFEAASRSAIRSPRAFLLKTATNLALNHVSRAGYKLNSSIDELVLAESEELTADSPESQFDANQRFMILCQAIGGLPEQCRRVFVLKKVYGLSQQEIADELGISQSTVEKHIARALLSCRDYMDSVGIDGAVAPAQLPAQRRSR